MCTSGLSRSSIFISCSGEKYFQHQRDCSRKLPLVLLLIELCFTWSSAEKQQEKNVWWCVLFLIQFHFKHTKAPTFWGPLWGSCSLYIDRHGEVYKTHMVASFRLIARSFCCDLDFLWDSSSFSALLRLCLRGNGFPSAFSRSS